MNELPEASECSEEEALRQRLLERFSDWLEEMTSGEQVGPPEGIARDLLDELEAEEPGQSSDLSASESCDLYSLWSAMTLLSQEIKLQGRSFGRLSERLAPLEEMFGSLDKSLDRLEQGREQRATRDAEYRATRRTIELIIDLIERSSPGSRLVELHLTSLERRIEKRRWFFRRRRAEDLVLAHSARAMQRGYGLCLQRLKEELGRIGVLIVPCRVGSLFDPHTMTAVEVESAASDLDGRVLEALSPAYQWRGETIRFAQVRVGRNTSRT